ncbi:molecular chaperone DnaJ [Aliivibrio fischeri]|uniref:molecular chaperone DnaJ n=1 Tax=Aliivibrio fischeri TaxID=668 RepID=UPI0012DA4A58|nr:molecular chaperone DnaJ [Aliivibrio fischeri]MUK71481.1 molecular chaperone DnaJ [Aliivibrio fischeri]MUK75252.1 molecular chaperone DnaJ [Aliivibrio fischeri]
MENITANLHLCKHCNETGTCTTGSEGNSCVACIKYHDLKVSKIYKGLACGTCGGLGMSEPLTERLNKRTKPLLAIGIVFTLLIFTFILGLMNSEHFSTFLAFSGTLIGSIITFYFSNASKNT